MSRFTDVPRDHWAAGAIARVADLGLLLGDPDGRYRPDAPLTRAEAAVILDRLVERPGFGGQPPLPELPAEPVGGAVQPWLPVDAPIRSRPGERRPELLALVIRQFQVATNPRYRAGHQGRGETYCNIYAWDVTRALGCEIPHWVNGDGDPAAPGRGWELDANRAIYWLRRHGEAHGWRLTTAEKAQAAANSGRPAVATWYNPTGGPGHMAILCPGGPAPDGQPIIAQAGATNFERRPLADGFGRRGPVEFWVHE